MEQRPPIPSRGASSPRPKGPRPQQYNSPEIVNRPVPPPIPSSTITRKVPRKPVGSAGAVAHPQGPRPLNQRLAAPPQHPQHQYEVPQQLQASPALPPPHEQQRPVSPLPPHQLQAVPSASKAPYPVSPLASPRMSPRLPYPRSPSPIHSSPRSSYASSNTSMPSIPPSMPSLPHLPSSVYPEEYDTTINVANMDDVVVYTDDFADMYTNESTSMESFPYLDSSSTHSSIPSVLKPGGMQLNLPEIPPLVAVRPKFSAEWLGVPELETCHDISILSALADWILFLNQTIDAEFSVESIVNAIAKLFMFKVFTINWIQAELLAAQAVRSLQDQGFIYGNDVLVLHPEKGVAGVLTTLTGNGCYSYHYNDLYSCYSSRCIREAPVAAPTQELVRRGSVSVKEGCGAKGIFEPDWSIYWGIPTPKGGEITKEVKRQFAIHELIYTESLYVHDLQVFTDVYGKLQDQVPSIMKQQREFCEAVFDKTKAILNLQKILFAKLKARQHQEGPQINIIADLVLEWAVLAKDAYMSYAADYLWTDQHLRTEMNSSATVEKWFSQTGRDSVLKGKPFQFFFNRVIPRALRYKLLLETIRKHSLETDAEFAILEKAIEATNQIGKSCDEAVDKATRVQELENINATIVFKDKYVEIDLKLDDSRRKLIKRGKMIRKSHSGIEWLESDVLLMDHFLILAKMKEGQNGNSLYITKRPILLDLLVLESQDDEPITNFSFLSGNSGAFNAIQNIDSRPRNLDADGEEQLAIYPIRIKHLGRQGASYTLYTANQIEREQWCNSIIEAKKASSARAFALNSQPFSLRLLSDTFGYPDMEHPNLPVTVNSMVMSRCIDNIKPGLVVAKSRVNCAASFGRDYYFMGLDYGLYFCRDRNVREWTRCLNLSVSSIRVVPEFNFLLILTRGHLVWYRLDEVVNRGFSDYPHKLDVPQGQRLTSQNKVSYFNLAFVRDRLQVLYIMSGGNNRGIHVLEPVRAKAVVPAQYSTELTKHHMGKQIDLNTIDFFRDCGRYEVTSEVIGFTPLLQSLVLQTPKGFKHMTFEHKLIQRLPVNNVVVSGKNKTTMPPSLFGPAMAIFRVSAESLLLCYQTCCAICTNSGRIILPLTKYLGSPERISFHPPYLILVSPELVEIRRVDTSRNASTRAKLCQVITGKDIRLLGSIEGQVRLAMAHPNFKERQLVVELAINEFVAIDDTSSLVTL